MTDNAETKHKKLIWLKVFNVRKEESVIVSDFFLHNFFLGLGLAMLLLVSETLFLSLFPVSQFPMVFVVSAISMMLSGRVYSYFEHKVPFKQLLPAILLVLILLTVVLWFMFFIKNFILLPIILITAFRVIYLLSNLEFWGLSSLVFDVRQGKRLFGLISSGDMPAKLLGYLSVYLFVPVIGLQNLLLISAVAFLVSRYFLLKIFRHPEYSQQHISHSKKHFSDKAVLKSFFGNEFIFSLAILGFITAAVFTIIEYSFLVNVKANYHTQEDLVKFLSIFLIVGYFFTLLIKLIFSGRFTARLGIRKTLLIMPIVLLGFSLMYVYFEINAYSFHRNLIFLSIFSVTCGIIKFGINDPVFLAMFQPLQTQLRLKGHTVIKGFVQPAALGIIGLLLLLSVKFYGGIDFIHLNYGLILFAIVWIASVYFSDKNYVLTLSEAIRKRFITGSDLGIVDDDYFEIIRTKIHSQYPEEVIYAISMFEKSNIDLLKEETPLLLKNKSHIILEQVIKIIGDYKWTEFNEDLYRIYNTYPEEKIKTKAIKVFCQLSNNLPPDFLSLTDGNSLNIRKSVIAGLLLNKNLNEVSEAENRLLNLCNSSIDAEKIAAIEIIGNLETNKFNSYVLIYLQDKNIDLQKEAVGAAGKIKSKEFVSALFDLLPDKKIKHEVVLSLSAMGQEPAKEIKRRLINNTSNSKNLIRDYIKILGNTDGEVAVEVLFEILADSTIDIRILVLSALNEMDCECSKEWKSTLTEDLNKEFAMAYWMLNSLQDKFISDTLFRSIQYELELCRKRIFLYLRLLYNGDVIKKAEAALNVVSKEHKANALEVLDQEIPRKLHDYLVALVDNITIPEKLEKLKNFKTGDKLSVAFFVMKKGGDWFSDWTIASAISQVEINDASMEIARDYLKDGSEVIKQSIHEAFLKFNEENAAGTGESVEVFISNMEDENIMSEQRTQRLSDIEKVIVLKSTALFSGTPENIIAEIVAIVKEEFVAKDDVIFRKGDSGSSMYVIYEGEVKIHNGDKVFSVLKSHDFFGELALLDPEPRSASATANVDTLLLKLNEEDAYELMEERTEVLKSIMRILCKRIRLQNEKIITGVKVEN
jgi:hypothetical protein